MVELKWYASILTTVESLKTCFMLATSLPLQLNFFMPPEMPPKDLPR